MRLLVTIVFLISLCAFPQLASAEQPKTIDELAAAFSIEKCIDCHEETHNEWKASWHAQSMTDSRAIRTWRTFITHGMDKEKFPRAAFRDMCLKCHAPQTFSAVPEVGAELADHIMTAANDPDQSKKDAALKELSKININCLICHNMKAVPGGQAQANVIYGPKGNPDTPHKDELGMETMKSEFLSKPEFCAECHHGCSPDMSSQRCPTLYNAYKDEYLAHGGDKTCQQCHMSENDEGFKSHRFPGVLDVDFAKTGIDLKIFAEPTEYTYHLENKVVPAVVLDVQVKNMAGHEIPHG